MRTRRAIGWIVTAVSGLALCAPGAASAQDNLSRPLDRDLGRTTVTPNGSVDFNRDRIFQQELRFRNAIVTGAVPSLSFRGDIGYTAPYEFRGELSSDDNFAFRRDSLISGLGGTGLRGTDALQYQFGLTTGTNLPSALTGSFTFNRDGQAYDRSPIASGVNSLDRANAPEAGVARAQDPLRLAPLDSVFGRRVTDLEARSSRSDADLPELRSLAAYSANQSLRQELLGRRLLGDDEQVEVTSSPLTGLRYRVEARPTFQSANRESLGAAQRVDMSVPKPAAESAYSDLIERLNRFDQRLQPERDEAEGDESAAPEALPILADEVLARVREQLLAGEEEAVEALRGDANELVPDDEDEEELPDIKRESNWYREHMLAGQEKLAEGRYFEAEGRFTSALGVRRGDTDAQIGRVNAQLGAGMLLSASVNLRQLLNEAPEVAALRFAPELRPALERSNQLIGLLRDRLTNPDKGAAAAIAPGTDPALLLAYLGRQIIDNRAVADGLAALEEGDPLRPLLYRAWGAPAGIEMPPAPEPEAGADERQDADAEPEG